MTQLNTEPMSKQVFDFFVRFPSSSLYEVQNHLDIAKQKCATTVNSLYKRGLLDRKKVVNRNTDIPRRHIYKYWATTDEFKRMKKITPKSLKAISKALKEFEAPAPVDAPKPPQIRPAPPETNTIHHNVTVTISAHPALLKLAERLASIL